MAYQWRFFRSGGVDQVQLTTGADLTHLDELDQKLWVALACPVEGTEFDARTLALIDKNGDKRVRAQELIEASTWLREVLSDPEILVKAGDSLPLSAISTETEEGKRIKATVERLLHDAGEEGAKVFGFEHLETGLEKFNHAPFNGDGVLTEAASADDAIKAALADIIACTEAPSLDRSELPGLKEEEAKAFFEALDARLAWLRLGDADEVQSFQEGSAAAYESYLAVREKVDDYFSRVRVAVYDSRALEAINREQAEYLEIAAKNMQISSDEVKQFPLARITGDGPLPLEEGLNPAWTSKMEAFSEAVLKPMFGAKPKNLTYKAWLEVRQRFQPYALWQDAEEGKVLAALSRERLLELEPQGLREAIDKLFQEEALATPVAEALEDSERLLRYRRDFLTIARNFVSFRDFYSRDKHAVFQVGRLYIDRRTTDLCLLVTDQGKHDSMAPLSCFYLLYCELKNAEGETKTIAAAITDGDTDNLMVGRNGIFYDRDGKDWDATIVKIVDNPISIRQAFWSPYKKVLRFIEEQINKRAQAAEDASSERLMAGAEAADASLDGAAPGGPDAPKKIDVGVVAAIGVAVGGLTAALGMMLEAFFGLGIWMPLGLLGLLLLISGPSMAIAWLKLRRRNLGPLLDANGWAVGTMARVNLKLGASLTALAELPAGAKRELDDPFRDKKRPWWLYGAFLLFLVLLALWFGGKLDGVLPNAIQKGTVFQDDPVEEVAVPPEAAPEGAAPEAAPNGDEAPEDGATE